MEKSHTFVGVLLPEAAGDCFRLQSAIQGEGKSPIIRDVLVQYIESKGWTVDSLTEDLSIQIYTRWYFKYRDKKNFAAYLKEEREDMEGRLKFPKRLTDKIIKLCKEQQKKQIFSNK